MFDTIVIEGLKLKTPKEVISLLKANSSDFPKEFQTKGLECLLNTYIIKENGNVFVKELRPTGKKIKHEPPFKGWNDNRPFLEKIYWHFKNKKYQLPEDKFVDETKPVFVKAKFTNTFTMLSYDEIGGRYLTLDYEVKVIEGKVKSVKLLRWDIESEKQALQRRKSDEEFKLKMDESFLRRKEFQARWYYPILKEIYNPSVFFFRITVQAICNALIKKSYHWTGV